MRKVLKFSVFLFFLALSFCICLFSSCVKEVKKKQEPEGKRYYKVTLVRDGRPVDSRVTGN